MTLDTRNAATLREARRTVAEFERITGLSTRAMLMCAEHDERLAGIDPFDLMDWHYALEQINALDNVVPMMHAGAVVDERSVFCGVFQYSRSNPRELTNSTEPELLLVA